jgi:hypothetical protein
MRELPQHDHRKSTLTSLTHAFLVANKLMQLEPVIYLIHQRVFLFYAHLYYHNSIRIWSANSTLTPHLAQAYGTMQMAMLIQAVQLGYLELKKPGRAAYTSWASTRRSPQIRVPQQGRS